MTIIRSEIEKEEFLKQIKNIRLSCKEKIKNEKMLIVNNIEKLLNFKLGSFEKAVNDELQNLISHSIYLNRIIMKQSKELKSLKGL